ncbi:MAG: ABC transporter ATP-binding protein [Chloroflexi bacterium]|nr:ABC transporter ATP-binding protein [Chloroflexota bacterium]
MSEVAIRVQGLGKKYRIGSPQARYDNLQDALKHALASPFRRAKRLLGGRGDGAADSNRIIWALKDVGFEVRRGEVVGIIGSNGAGKSTLLKILSRITEPTEGLAEIHGHVGSLLEVGTGFHPELTGRDNIYLNGAILGLRRAEIDRKFDEIVAFSEIEKFIDTPVKHYSSGMYVRLAFAVAAHMDPEILLVDEVLAVGDYRFQDKCLGKMQEATGQGRTILFVSHNMKAISQICDRAILLADGRVEIDDTTSDVIRRYTGVERQDNADIRWSLDDAPGNHSVRLLRVHVCDDQGQVKSSFAYREAISICVTYEVLDDTVNLYLRTYLDNEAGVDILVTTELDNSRFSKGVHQGKYTIPPHFLNEGRYVVQQVLFKEGSVTSPEDVARVDYPVNFSIDYSGMFNGGVMAKPVGVIRPDWGWAFSEISRSPAQNAKHVGALGEQLTGSRNS